MEPYFRKDGACECTFYRRNTCMVREHHVAVLPANHVSAFYIGLYVSGGSHIKYIYMISQEHSHMVLPDYTSLSHLYRGSENDEA